MTEMLELSDKGLKAAIIKMLQGTVMNRLETNKKLESLSKEIEDIEKNHMEILGLKNMIIEINNNKKMLSDVLNSRLEGTEEKIIDLEIVQQKLSNLNNREKTDLKNEQSLKDLWDYKKNLMCMSLNFQKEMKREWC